MTDRIGVMGAGVMGAGIAQVMAIAGHEVVCYDLSADAISKAREGVDTGRFGVRGAVERGKLTSDEADAAMVREAARVVQEGVASHEEVDQLVVDCSPWPSGPFGMTRGVGSGWS